MPEIAGGPRKPRRNPEKGNNLESQVDALLLQLPELLIDRKKEEVFRGEV